MSEVKTPVFYLNENIDVRLVNELNRLGLEAVHTRDVGNRGATDDFQLEYAAKKNYILVSLNRRDYRLLHQRWLKQNKKHSGILIFGPAKADCLARRIKLFLDKVYPFATLPFCEVPPPLL